MADVGGEEVARDPEVRQSRSRRGNGYDNAPAEPLGSRFKAERLAGGRLPGLAEARRAIRHHLAYYNAERRHPATAPPTPPKPACKPPPHAVRRG